MPSGEGRLTLTNPIARSGALACAGWYHWLEGEHRAAQRAWTRAGRAAERLAMPWELANAHAQLGPAPGRRAALPARLDAAEHLDRARSILEALGCRGGVEDQTLPSP